MATNGSDIYRTAFHSQEIEYQMALVLGLVFGIFNIVPYVGPLLAGTLGIILGVATSYGASGYPGVIVVRYCNGSCIHRGQHARYLFQPLIYSSSVKAHPLEIFLVILISGFGRCCWHVGGYSRLHRSACFCQQFLPGLK